MAKVFQKFGKDLGVNLNKFQRISFLTIIKD
jgi:hypothetical protein